MEMTKRVLFNLSGHPAPMGSPEDTVTVPVPNVVMAPDKISEAATVLVDTLPEDVVARGQYEVILPGMTPLAAAVLAVLHGRTGCFPMIRFSSRRDGGFVLSEPLDLQNLRLAARESREKR